MPVLKRTFVLGLCLGLSLLVQAQFDESKYTRFPDYRTVVTNLLDDCNIYDFVDQEAMVNFMKKPDGWYVVEMDPANPKNNKREKLFWSAREGEFYCDRKSKNDRQLTAFKIYMLRESLLRPGRGKKFDRNLYWGYPNWARDVVSELAEVKPLPDRFANYLAKAYNELAGPFVWPDFVECAPNLNYQYDSLKACADLKRLDHYLTYTQLARDQYIGIFERNPQLDTITGTILNDFYNQYVLASINLAASGLKERADKTLQRDLYGPYQFTHARNILLSCDSNAILFMQGDHSYYSVVYAQETMGLRPDVTIVNIDLATTGRYIYYLTNPNTQRNPLHTSLPISIYNEQLESYLIKDRRGNPPDSLKLPDFLQKVKQRSEDVYTVTGSNTAKYTYYSTHFQLPVSDSLFQVAQAPDTSKFALLSKLAWDFNSPLLQKYHLFLLDVIATNAWERPVYFMVNLEDESYMGLQRYFQLRGLVQQLLPYEVKGSEEHDTYEYLDIVYLYDLLFNTMEWPGLSLAVKASNKNLKIYQDYLYLITRYSQRLFEDNRSYAVTNILKRYFAAFPDSIFPPNYRSYQIVEVEFQSSRLLKAFAAVRAIRAELSHDLDRYLELKKKEQLDRKGEIKRRMEVLNTLAMLCQRYEQQHLVDELQDTYRYYSGEFKHLR